ncbi:hypothetical protein CRM22_005489 [Opisthorchis felineus]|uniref:Uncharacterized protein n=1 Tax=Opisthorchis felineus TaxID=147828 RepID=A0A4S2LQU9_OPIFE|nr:hypothetical protein CRM22_005489 [Opisthorchis felineus]
MLKLHNMHSLRWVFLARRHAFQSDSFACWSFCFSKKQPFKCTAHAIWMQQVDNHCEQAEQSDPIAEVDLLSAVPTDLLKSHGLNSGLDDHSNSSLPENDQIEGGELDPLTSEYLEAAYALRSRREARRQRRIRLKKHIEHTQQMMREADIERKRWIPARVLRRVGRFFSENGLVQSPRGAFIICTAITTGVTFLFVVAYRYWFPSVR